VAGDTVAFVPLRWADLLYTWSKSPVLAAHVAALRARYPDLG
jgi:hypothetical protein